MHTPSCYAADPGLRAAKLPGMELGGFRGADTPEGAEQAFLRAHPELEDPDGPYAFGTVSDARRYVLEVCTQLAEIDQRAVGRLLPEHVLESHAVMSKGSYNPNKGKMWLRLLVKFSALHEIAHWLAPSESERTQHFKPWRDAQVMLVASFLDESYATELANAYAAAAAKAPDGRFGCDGPIGN